MSRNFELLRRLGQDVGSYESPFGPVEDGAPTARSITSIPKHRPRIESSLSEEFEHLVNQVFIVPGKAAPNVVAFADVGSHPEAGGVCARAADVLAAQSRSVCVVDANPEAATLHGYFDITNERGFSDALREHHSIVDYGLTLEGGALTVIPAGVFEAKPSPVLAADALSSRMMELRQRFRFVLVHCPPLGRYGDGALIGRLTDGLILVIEANLTRREAARKAKEDLDRVKVRVIGTVLTNHDMQTPQILGRF